MQRMKRKVFYALAVIGFPILLLMLPLLSAELGKSYIYTHQHQIETWASKLMSQPVTLGGISIARDGITPYLQLENVLVKNDADTEVLLKADTIKIGVAFWHSLFKWRIVPDGFVVTGAHLALYRNQSGSLQIYDASSNGKSLAFADMQNRALTLTDLLEWLTTQSQVIFHDVTLDWHDKRGKVFTVRVYELQLQPKMQVLGSAFDGAEQNAPQFLAAFQFKLYFAANALQTQLNGSVGGLVRWLDHALSDRGHITGEFSLYRPLASPLAAKATLHFATFPFQEGWPALDNMDADVWFDGTSVKIKVERATITGVPTTDLTAEITDFAKPMLHIHGAAFTNMADGVRFLAKSPLKTTLGHSLSTLDLSGKLHLDLTLDIPLGGAKAVTKVGGKIFLADNGVGIIHWGIPVNKLAGEFDFSESGVSANNLTAEVFSYPVRINVASDTKSPATNVVLDGKADIGALRAVFARVPQTISGDFVYHAALNLYQHGSAFDDTLLLHSDLQGATINLPPPLGKDAPVVLPSIFRMVFKGNQVKDLTVDYGTFLKGQLIFDNMAMQSLRPRLVLSGAFPTIDLSLWQNFLKNNFLEAIDYSAVVKKATEIAATRLIPLIDKIDLKVATLNFLGQKLNDVLLSFQPAHNNKNEWQLNILSDNINGALFIPEHYPWSSITAHFSKLHLNSSGDEMAEVNLETFPALVLTSSDTFYNNKKFGKLALILEPQSGALSIKKLNIDAQYFTITASGKWSKVASGSMTKMSGRLTTADLGALFKDLELGGNLVGGDGHCDFALSWPDLFYAPHVGILRGDFSLNFANGRIINLGDAAEAKLGVGRLLSLLSLQSLPRHLLLDFSDITTSGFAFDHLVGDFKMQDGNVFTQNGSLDGSIAKVTIKGKIGVKNKDYDLLMIADAHGTTGLPLVAALAGGPVAAAVTWFASNIFNYEVQKVASHSYVVKGSWNNPSIEQNDRLKAIKGDNN